MFVLVIQGIDPSWGTFVVHNAVEICNDHLVTACRVSRCQGTFQDNAV